jgi:hypothetical protein
LKAEANHGLSLLNATGYSATAKRRDEDRNLKSMLEELNHLKRRVAMNASVLNVQNLISCPENLQYGFRILNAINEPTTVMANLATIMFVGTAALMTIIMISCMIIDMKW